MRSDYEYLKKLLNNLIKLQNKIKEGAASENEKRDWGSLNDYFFYLTLDALQNEQKGLNLYGTYTKLEGYCEDIKCEFYEAFFFSLSELLTLKHKIRAGVLEIVEKGDFLSKEAWQKRFKNTKERLGL